MKQIVWRLLAVVALVLLTSCGSGGGGAGGGTDDVVVADEVRVLDAAAREDLDAFSLDLDTGAGEIRFAADSAFAAAVEPGAILVTEPVAGLAPHGFLQRVKAKRTEGDEIVLETEQATLIETFEQAEIAFEQPLRPEDVVESEALYDGVALRYGETRLGPQASAGFDFDVAFDEVLIDLDEDESTTDDQLRIDGAFSFDATASGDIDIGWFELDRFYAKIRLEESVDVRMRGHLATGFEERVEVARFDFGTFTVMVGPVPVVFVLDMVVSVGAQGEIEAELVASAAQSTTVQVGAEYTDDGGWDDLNEFDSDFDFPTPTVTASASASASLQPRVNLKIYGLAGPYAYAEAFVEADAEMHRDPFWRFEAGLDFGVGFVIDLPVVGRVGQWSTETRVLEEELGRSENGSPELELLGPGDPHEVLDGHVARFEVRASDREQDEVTVQLLDEAGTVVSTRTAAPGATVLLPTPQLCVENGSYEFSVRAVDDDGATTTRGPVSITVANQRPELELVGTPILPAGKFGSIRARAIDGSCDGYDTADDTLIEWTIDGDVADGSPAEELILQVPTAPFEVVASYTDDRGLTGTFRTTLEPAPVESGDLPPMVTIDRPTDGQYISWVFCSYDSEPANPLVLEGRAIDPEAGDISDAIEWRLARTDDHFLIAHGERVEVDPCDLMSGPDSDYYGAYDVTLSVEDESGQRTTETITIRLGPEG